ncbi:MAG: RICIN domain-containing protein, partial [Bacteroidetes bacterium]|nr:RICIN domain-containing protein [Bacteroidota bacterium]
NKNVSWSSNTAAATVSATGVVTGVSEGYASIFATTEDGSHIGIAQVQVTANSKPVAAISAAPTSGSAPLVIQFSASNSTDPNPGDYILGYDWDFGDGSPRANSNAPSHTYSSAGTYTVTLRVMDNHDLYSDPVSTTITVNDGGNGNGSVVRELWSNITGTTVAEIPTTTAPTSTSNLTSLEAPTDVADNYGVRIRGYITPATTGTYKFYIAADDNAEFWLNTSGTVSRIAYVEGWTAPRQWDKYPTTQQSADISLTAGTKYYFEVLHKEGGGGDNLAVGWTGPGISAITVVPGAVLSPYDPETTGFSGTYTITARHSSKALDVANSSTADGGNVQQYTANGTAAQQWVISATTDGYYKIENKGSNKALEVAGNGTADGDNVQQWSYVGSNSQQWKIEATTDGFYKLTNRHSGKALDVSGVSSSDGANVHQWNYVGGGNQQWKLEQISTASARMATTEAEISSEKEMGEELLLYPNPVTAGTLTLELGSAEAGRATVSLTSVLGQRTVSQEFSVEKGQNTISVSTRGLAKGLYLVTLQQGSNRTVIKVYVQ